MLKVNSFRKLRRLKDKPVVQLQRAGGFYKARWPGRANFIFGATVGEARNRLLRASSSFQDSHFNAEVRKRNQVLNWRKAA